MFVNGPRKEIPTTIPPPVKLLPKDDYFVTLTNLKFDYLAETVVKPNGLQPVLDFDEDFVPFAVNPNWKPMKRVFNYTTTLGCHAAFWIDESMFKLAKTVDYNFNYEFYGTTITKPGSTEVKVKYTPQIEVMVDPEIHELVLGIFSFQGIRKFDVPYTATVEVCARTSNVQDIVKDLKRLGFNAKFLKTTKSFAAYEISGTIDVGYVIQKEPKFSNEFVSKTKAEHEKSKGSEGFPSWGVAFIVLGAVGFLAIGSHVAIKYRSKFGFK